ncbi:MAG: thiamine pyrophosphate-dependent enzyme, partial [bacterium]
MDPRFTQASGLQAYTGVELLVKGALEGGVSLITGYPGSPVADVFDAARAAKDYLEEHGIVAVLAHNEALAAARLNGSQMQDIRAMAVMKSVGAHVASDALAIGNLAKTGQQGGALVVIGDDPWSDSTQVPADSRYLASHIHMPVLEPSTFQELKDWVKTGFELSAKSNLYLAYLVTTNQADGGAVVETRPNVPPKISRTHKVEIDTDSVPVEETVLLPPRTSRNEEQLHERYRTLWGFARDWGVNTVLGEPSNGHRAPIGLVAGGLAYCYLEHALRLLGLTGRFPILKLGISYPVDPGIVQAFAGMVEKIVVIEEKRGFVESQIVTILNHLLQGAEIAAHVPVWGKEFPMGLEGFPATRGLSPSLVMERLARLLLRTGLLKDPAEIARAEEWLGLFDETALYHVNIPARTPTFCPGCPHRDSSAVLMEIKKDFRNADYMRKGHRRGPVDLVFHGDTGCYTMLMFEPTKALMHNYSGIGLGGGTGAGIDPFITNKQVVFMGDSTFFHSGMIAVSDAVKNHQDIAFIILDNKTTAMTGHQPTPSVDVDMMGKPTFAQDIEQVLGGMTHGAGIDIVRA